MKAIAYLRVSTQEQKNSGLGLNAQRQSIEQFCQSENIELIATHQEVETGKGSDALSKRPVLAKTLSHAKKEGASIIVSKLDRLGRNVNFISGLMESKVSFIVTQLGINADSFMLHLYAALSEKERELISTRTKEALQALKAKGVVLGNQTNLPKARLKSNVTNKRLATDFATKLLPMIKGYRKEGLTLSAIATKLNELGVTTRRGGKWYASTVTNILNHD